MKELARMTDIDEREFPRWLEQNGFEYCRESTHGSLYRCPITKRYVSVQKSYGARNAYNFRAQVNRIMKLREELQKEQILKQQPVTPFKLSDVANIQRVEAPAKRKMGNPRIHENARLPKNFLSEEEVFVLDSYVQKCVLEGKRYDWIAANAKGALPGVKGSLGKGPTDANLRRAYAKARRAKRELGDTTKAAPPPPVAAPAPEPKPAQAEAVAPTTKPGPAAPRPDHRLPHFAIVILTDTELTDSEKVKMLCAFASL